MCLEQDCTLIKEQRTEIGQVRGAPWKKTIALHISDESIVFIIYQDHLKLSNKTYMLIENGQIVLAATSQKKKYGWLRSICKSAY